ncbi:hypothetical protein AAG906_033156 [Vitis piasezkii]
MSEATNKSPFELTIGQQPLTPHTLAMGYTGKSPVAFNFAKGWYEQVDIARSYLDKVYKVEDMVLVKLFPQQFKSLRPMHKGLGKRYEGLFPILVKVSKVEDSSVFHINYIKPYHKDKNDPSRALSKRAPTTVMTSYDNEVEHIITDRVIMRQSVSPTMEYPPETEANWELAHALWQF